MNKLAKTIIGVLVGIIVVLIVVIIILTTNKNKEDVDISNNTNNDEIKQLVGVYLYTNATNDRANKKIQLNEDMTCMYLYDYNECKWSISDKTITFEIARYKIDFDSDSSGIGGINDFSSTEDICKEKIVKYTEKYKLVNPRCIYDKDSNPIKATIVNSGLLIGNVMYYKIG